MKKLLLALLLVCLLPAFARAANLMVLDRAGLDEIVAANRGKVIMANFFATWCPPCRAEIADLIKSRQKFPEDGFLLLGLSVDEDISAVKPFMEKTGINYPVYLVGKDVTDSFGISSVPYNAFYDRGGSLVIASPGLISEDLLDKVVGDLLSRSEGGR